MRWAFKQKHANQSKPYDKRENDFFIVLEDLASAHVAAPAPSFFGFGY
jgi:hypothetical protein